MGGLGEWEGLGRGAIEGESVGETAGIRGHLGAEWKPSTAETSWNLLTTPSNGGCESELAISHIQA